MDAFHRLPGKFVWFEHQSSALPTARRFYDALFNWHTETMPMGPGATYPLILREGGQGIGGYRDLHPGTPSRWMGYLSVPDVDATFHAALAAGAHKVEAPREFGPAGRGAVLADPCGALFALWHDAQGDQPDLDPAPPGAWCWMELYSTDVPRSLAFYQRVFGHEVEPMAYEGKPYHLLKKDGIARAGITPSRSAAAGSMWLPYVSVADIEAVCRDIPRLDGKLMYGPKHAEGVGRYAILVDPAGAAVAAIQLQAQAAST